MKYKQKNGSVRVVTRVPKGWNVEEPLRGQPIGTTWVTNGQEPQVRGKDGKLKPNPKFRYAMIMYDEKSTISEIAKNRRSHIHDGFITDKKTETKVQKEIQRQNEEAKRDFSRLLYENKQIREYQRIRKEAIEKAKAKLKDTAAKPVKESTVRTKR